MNTSMDTNMLLIVALIVALVLVAFFLFTRRRRSQDLEQHFGAEYGRTVERMGSRDKAEAELQARRQRVDQLQIVPLPPEQAQRFAQQWRTLQARFVDSPSAVLSEADQLVRDLLQQRGYPVGDFERRAADISVHHPGVVEHYRAAHAISERAHGGVLDTETQRQALIHYRALFAELLETGPTRPGDPAHPQMRTQP